MFTKFENKTELFEALRVAASNWRLTSAEGTICPITMTVEVSDDSEDVMAYAFINSSPENATLDDFDYEKSSDELEEILEAWAADKNVIVDRDHNAVSDDDGPDSSGFYLILTD